jgi:hypothetical protein
MQAFLYVSLEAKIEAGQRATRTTYGVESDHCGDCEPKLENFLRFCYAR